MASSAADKTVGNKTSEQREGSTVSILGCGRNGILHACLFVEAGFKVICFDSDRALAESVSKAEVPFLKNKVEPILRRGLDSGRLTVSTILEEISAQSRIAIVTTSAIVNEKGRIDYSNIEKTLKQFGRNLQEDTLIIIASTVGVGVTESFLKEILESVSGLKSGIDFYFTYSPVPFPEEQTLSGLASLRRIVAAKDRKSLEKASSVISVVTRTPLIKTLDVKAAEAAVLFEAAHKNTDFALTNEFAVFCEKTGIDYFAVQKLWTDRNGTPMQPALNCCSCNEAVLMLLEDAENQNVKFRVSAAALELNKEALKHAVSLVHEALKSCGKPLRRAKIAVLGVSQTRNLGDTPKSSLKKFIEMLKDKGVKLSLYDPYFSNKPSAELELTFIKRSLTEAAEGADCIVIFTGHDQFKRLNLRKLRLLAKMPAAIVDFEGVLDLKKVEDEGFIYRGLGRGLWKK